MVSVPPFPSEEKTVERFILLIGIFLLANGVLPVINSNGGSEIISHKKRGTEGHGRKRKRR
jgi:hypothetical protein